MSCRNIKVTFESSGVDTCSIMLFARHTILSTNLCNDVYGQLLLYSIHSYFKQHSRIDLTNIISFDLHIYCTVSEVLENYQIMFTTKLLMHSHPDTHLLLFIYHLFGNILCIFIVQFMVFRLTLNMIELWWSWLFVSFNIIGHISYRNSWKIEVFKGL